MATKDQQVKEIVEGLALGCLSRGVDGISANKLTLELALSQAWTRWSDADKFPSIRAGVGSLSINSVYLGFGSSEGRRSVKVAWLREPPWLRPYLLFQDYSIDEAHEVMGSRVALSSWSALATHLADALGERFVRRVAAE